MISENTSNRSVLSSSIIWPICSRMNRFASSIELISSYLIVVFFGIVKVIVVPLFGSDSILNSPPRYCSIYRLQRNNPWPVPDSLVVKPSVAAFCRTSGGMPGPLSSTVISTCSSVSFAFTPMEHQSSSSSMCGGTSS